MFCHRAGHLRPSPPFVRCTREMGYSGYAEITIFCLLNDNKTITSAAFSRSSYMIKYGIPFDRGASSMSKNRILIVEDDTYIAENIGINLDMSGYDYTIMTDGLCAANHLKNDHSYDLALLDIMLPGMDGFALMEYMQKYNIPVLYLTAKSDLSSRIKGLRDGAEDYIVKPFEMLELLVRMEKILERTGKLHTILRYRDITIDTEKRIVTKCGEAVALQPLEFDLLVMLVRFKNCTLSRDRLLNEIWGIEYLGVRTVDTHIAMLRKKLGLESGIVAVTKIGYRLED